MTRPRQPDPARQTQDPDAALALQIAQAGERSGSARTAARLAVEIAEARQQHRADMAEASSSVADAMDWTRFADDHVPHDEITRRRDWNVRAAEGSKQDFPGIDAAPAPPNRQEDDMGRLADLLDRGRDAKQRLGEDRRWIAEAKAAEAGRDDEAANAQALADQQAFREWMARHGHDADNDTQASAAMPAYLAASRDDRRGDAGGDNTAKEQDMSTDNVVGEGTKRSNRGADAPPAGDAWAPDAATRQQWEAAENGGKRDDSGKDDAAAATATAGPGMVIGDDETLAEARVRNGLSDDPAGRDMTPKAQHEDDKIRRDREAAAKQDAARDAEGKADAAARAAAADSGAAVAAADATDDKPATAPPSGDAWDDRDADAKGRRRDDADY